MSTVHTLVLGENARPILGVGQVLCLPIPYEKYTLRVVIPGTSPALNKTKVLRCNFPVEGTSFNREEFQELELNTDDLTKNVVVELLIYHSGSFAVEIGEVKWNFVVGLGFEQQGHRFDADGLCIQTVLAKLVDPGQSVRSSKWKETLAKVAQKKYNMIHFVPLQPRGESDSPYSILDQLAWDSILFPKGESDVESLMSELKELDVYGLSDIVLNHTASNSHWLAGNLDAGYNPINSPHLQVAIELDTQLLKLGHGESINNSSELNRLVPAYVHSAAHTSKLWEFYVLDVEKIVEKADSSVKEYSNDKSLPAISLANVAAELREASQNSLTKLGARFERSVDFKKLITLVSKYSFSAKQILDEVNITLYAEYNDDLKAAMTAIRDRQRYLRLDSDGPKIGLEINKKAPLIESYFNRNFGLPLANNGWVWGGNPMIDHAGPNSKAYIRRELMVWGDCVKLRYGDGPDDCPYLWERMGDYASLLARYFHGLRLDNAHSTPLHVAEFILDKARKVRPNLYVVAELFSGSQEIDKLYVERLSINSLLREAIMPGNPKDLSTLIHISGGKPIGSFIDSKITGVNTHSWLMEVTHDNEVMAHKRTVEDTLSTAALVAMCQAASGSTLGNDEAYGEALNVVSESRPYIMGGGITDAKAILNGLHQEMASKDMYESYTDHRGQYITVHRISPENDEGVFMVARTKFWPDSPQEIGDILLEGSDVVWGNGWSLINIEDQEKPGESDKIYQIPTKLKALKPIKVEKEGNNSKIFINENEFPQGSVAFWRTTRSFDAAKVEELVREDADQTVKELSLLDLNELLYHIDSEERVCTGNKRGAYSIPDYGSLIYCGLQGWYGLIKDIVSKQDLGHPLCENLRNGLWAFEYLADRGDKRFHGVKKYARDRLNAVRDIPNFLRPRYFASTVEQLYKSATSRALNLMDLDPKETSEFFRSLSLVSVQMVAEVPNTSLFPTSQTATMAAGIPHFSEGVMRCWGRDVFLSVGGLLTKLKRSEEFESHVLGFGATLKYGLIPNLLDSGRNPRYNARDAVWFFVQSIQEYCRETDSLDILHKKTRRRFPLDDSWTDEPTTVYSTVGDLVIEVLERHAAGIKFREHNAGSQIDMHMKSNGFNQHIWTDWSNGIIFGGNQDNCGTWQDKMGESERAGNDGVPGTPRDGAAIEITGMLKSCLRWVNELRRSGHYDWPETVKNENGDNVKLDDWEKLLQDNFERCYYVPESQDTKTIDNKEYDVDWSIVNRRGIYKDLYRTGKPFEDYQLRANFTIAVLAAPELFDAKKIMATLELADDVLCGPVGIATLDPSDWNYRPYYINGDDSTDFATSRGRNYHQGPEWVWEYGTFLQALVQTMKRLGKHRHEILATVRDHVQGHVKWISESPYAGLTELTQKNGELCGDSSPTQAWSAARLIEAILEVNQ